jgi:cysteine desulfurase
VRRVYLDWNATTPPLPDVVAAMAVAAAEAWGNPSSVHQYGRAARGVVENARAAVARLARCDPRDVVFTSGGTEANNLALRSAFPRCARERPDVPRNAREDADVPRNAPGGVLVTSRLEHPSVTRVAEALEREGRARVRWLRVLPQGTVDLADVERALAEGGVRLVAVQAVNAETGVVQPVAEVIAMARRAGAAVHVDAVQAFGRTDDVWEEADTRSMAAHKMRGPKSIGALVMRPGVAIEPVLVGGSQERGIRPGTGDPIAAAGFAVAATYALESPKRWREARALRDALEAGLLAAGAAVPLRVPRGAGVRVNGAGAPRAAHVTSVAFPGWSSPELVAALDLEGVAASGGSACSAGTAEPSGVLAAMGDDEAALCSVRFSLGDETTRGDVDAALEAVARVLRRS